MPQFRIRSNPRSRLPSGPADVTGIVPAQPESCRHEGECHLACSGRNLMRGKQVWWFDSHWLLGSDVRMHRHKRVLHSRVQSLSETRREPLRECVQIFRHDSVQRKLSVVWRLLVLPTISETQRRSPDRDVYAPGQFAGLFGPNVEGLSDAPHGTGIPLPNPIGQWRSASFRRHDLSRVNFKADRR